MTLYKWLLEDNTTPVQKKPWTWAIGEWTPQETPVLCESGWHGVELKNVLDHFPQSHVTPVLYEVETSESGVVLHGDDKFACSSMRLVRQVGRGDTMTLVKFALACARSTLANFESVFPRDTRVRDCLDIVEKFTQGEATPQECESAAESARSAAESARSAAESAAESAAWSAAESVAWSAAAAAAWSAAHLEMCGLVRSVLKQPWTEPAKFELARA